MCISAPSCKILARTTMYWNTGNNSSMLQLYSEPHDAWPALLISLNVSSRTSSFSNGVNLVLICCSVSIAITKCRSRTWEMLFRDPEKLSELFCPVTEVEFDSRDQNFSSTPRNESRAMSGCRFHLKILTINEDNRFWPMTNRERKK